MVGMKLEQQMVLQDDSGPVCYRLAIIIFRTGGLSDGHFYIAAPTTPGMWSIFNNQTAQKAMLLKELQLVEGRHAHGTMYVRTKAPATDDWGCLNTTGSMLGSVSQLRYAALRLHGMHTHYALAFFPTLSPVPPSPAWPPPLPSLRDCCQVG